MIVFSSFFVKPVLKVYIKTVTKQTKDGSQTNVGLLHPHVLSGSDGLGLRAADAMIRTLKQQHHTVRRIVTNADDKAVRFWTKLDFQIRKHEFPDRFADTTQGMLVI